MAEPMLTNPESHQVRPEVAYFAHCCIHCLPYHRLGEAKIGRIGTGRPSTDINIPDRPDLRPVVERFAGEEIHVVACD